MDKRIRQLTRREFLQLSAFTVSSAILSACASVTPTRTVLTSSPLPQTIQPTPTTQQLATPTATRAPAAIAPKTFLLDLNVLAAVKAKVAAGGKTYDAPLAKLVRDAESALKQGPFTVTSKTQAAPSGDKHDFYSQGPYYWPDPSKPNGLPYLSRDGERNPEVDNISDDRNMSLMISTSQTLALAYYFKGDERYAERAALILQAWFLDPATRMNPNMNHAQAIPGRHDGSGIGIIDSHNLPQVLDAVGLIAGSKAWSMEDDRGMRDWFAQYLDWMTTSKNGQQEAKQENNHGSFYDAQIIAIATSWRNAF